MLTAHTPGKIIQADKTGIYIATGKDILVLDTICRSQAKKHYRYKTH